MPSSSSDNSSTSTTSALESFDFDGLVRNIFGLVSNYFSDPSITTGISQVASDAIRNAINGAVSDNSSRGMPGMLGRISGLSNSPTLSSIGNLMSMNPFLAKLTGSSDVRIAQEVAGAIGRRNFGMLNSPMREVNTLIAGANIQDFWQGFADSNSPFKKGMNQSHAFLAANWLNQSGAIGQAQFTDAKGMGGESEKLMSSAMEMLSIGKNILGMGDDVYAILNQVSVLGGGKGKQFEEAASRFKDYISQLVAEGLDMAEIQSAITHANGQIQTMMAAGYDATTAAAYARQSTAAAFSVAKEMQGKGKEYNAGAEANKTNAQMAAVDAQSGGISLNAQAVTLNMMKSRGLLTEEQSQRLSDLMASGNLTDDNLKSILGANYAKFNQFYQGVVKHGSQDPAKLASMADKGFFGAAAREAKGAMVLSQMDESVRYFAGDFGEKNRQEILDAYERIKSGNYSEADLDLMEASMPGVGNNIAAWARLRTQQKQGRERTEALMNAVGAKKISKIDILSSDDFTKMQDAVKKLNGGEGQIMTMENYDEALANTGMTQEKLDKLFESKALKDKDYVKITGEDNKDYYMDRYGNAWSVDEETKKKLDEEKNKKEEKENNPIVAALQTIVDLMNTIYNEFKGNKPPQSENNLNGKEKEEASGVKTPAQT